MSEIKPPDFRDMEPRLAYSIRSDEAGKILEHRRLILAATPEEMGRINQSVDTTEIGSSKDRLSKLFPNYQKAIWLFEKAPEDKIINITSAEKIYREHTRLSYRVGDETKRVILKKTKYGRMERMLAQTQKLLGLPSFRVLCADGNSPGVANIETVQTGEFKSVEQWKIPVEQFVTIAPTSYAVVEEVMHPNTEIYRHGQLRGLPKEKQTQFIHNLGKIRAFENIFALVDEKDEHLLVNPENMEICRIDMEQGLKLFSNSFDYSSDMHWKHFPNGLTGNEAKLAFFEGLNNMASVIRNKLPEIREIIRRNTNFGVIGYNTTVGLGIYNDIEYQLDQVEKHIIKNQPKREDGPPRPRLI